MAQDVYGKTQDYGNSRILTADVMLLSIGSLGTPAQYLIQNINLQYNQPVNRVFEVGSSLVFFAPGRSIGSLQIGRIVGTGSIVDVVGKTGTGIWTTDPDQEHSILLQSVGGGLGGFTQVVKWQITGAVIEGYGVATDANGLLVQESIQMQFASLSIT